DRLERRLLQLLRILRQTHPQTLPRFDRGPVGHMGARLVHLAADRICRAWKAHAGWRRFRGEYPQLCRSRLFRPAGRCQTVVALVVVGRRGTVLYRLSRASAFALALQSDELLVGADRARFICLEHRPGWQPSLVYLLSSLDEVLGIHRWRPVGMCPFVWPHLRFTGAFRLG